MPKPAPDTSSTSKAHPARPKVAANPAGPPPGANRARQPNTSPAGFYAGALTAGEVKLVSRFRDEPQLLDEFWAQRSMNVRLVDYVGATDDMPTLIKLHRALGEGIGRAARLLRDQRALVGEQADGLAGAITQALDELGAEWGVAFQ